MSINVNEEVVYEVRCMLVRWHLVQYSLGEAQDGTPPGECGVNQGHEKDV